jgi:tRNA pseudouridine38-40 synthase
MFSPDSLQSLLNLQRKMMSILVLSCRTGTPPRLIDEVTDFRASLFSMNRRFLRSRTQMYRAQIVFVPKMPSLGLLLEHPIFDSYNTKVANINVKLEVDSPDYRPPIDFEIYRDKMEQFKQHFVYDDMRMTEDRDGMYVLFQPSSLDH